MRSPLSVTPLLIEGVVSLRKETHCISVQCRGNMFYPCYHGNICCHVNRSFLPFTLHKNTVKLLPSAVIVLYGKKILLNLILRNIFCDFGPHLQKYFEELIFLEQLSNVSFAKLDISISIAKVFF